MTVKVDQINGKVAGKADGLICPMVPTHRDAYPDSLIIFCALFSYGAANFIANVQTAQMLHYFIL